MKNTEQESNEVSNAPKTIRVNNAEILFEMESPTPEDIKQRAIEEGVEIDIGFELAGEDENGDDVVMRESVSIDIERFKNFTATAPDDNA